MDPGHTPGRASDVTILRDGENVDRAIYPVGRQREACKAVGGTSRTSWADLGMLEKMYGARGGDAVH